MSIRVITWVWDHSQATNGPRLVLLAIADNAADDGSHAYPSIAELTRKSRLSERAVQAALRKLVELGELRIELNGAPGRARSNMYTVVMTPQNLHPAESAPLTPQNLHPNPAESAPGTVPDPSDEPSTPPSGAPHGNSERTTARGTRLPADWMPGAELRTWFTEQRFGGDPARWREEHDRFRDYWAAAPGSRGVKIDWDATWRNWMRRAAESLGDRRPPGSSGAPTGGFRTAAERNDARAHTGQEVARIADGLAEQRGVSPDDVQGNLEVLAEARRIHAEQVARCSGRPYTATIEGAWMPSKPGTTREVTTGNEQGAGPADADHDRSV